MNLDDAQRNQVSAWITEGLKLSEIQNRLATEFSLRLTYMEVRMLVDDLKLTPKDIERPKAAVPLAPVAAAPASILPANEPAEPAPLMGVSVTVDQIARAGAIASGKVTFSDGNQAAWYLDQTGRLGLATDQPGYRPPAADVQQFQLALESELSKLGL
jgi:hypothetical protein